MSERRKIFGEKIIDLGNYTLVALVLGQLALQKTDYRLVGLGLLFALLLWSVGYILLKKGGKK